MNSTQLISYLIAALVFTAAFIVSIESDLEKWKKTQRGIPTPVNHFTGWWARLAMLLPVIILLTVAHPAENGYHKETLFVLLNASGLIGFIWWFMFDGIFNLERGENWWFLGSFNDAGHGDAWLDILQQKIGPTLSKLLKVGGILVMLTIYIFSFIKHS